MCFVGAAASSNCGRRRRACLTTVNRRLIVIGDSIAVPQTSPSPWAACVSPTENSAPATCTGSHSFVPRVRSRMSMFPPTSRGGTIEGSPRRGALDVHRSGHRVHAREVQLRHIGDGGGAAQLAAARIHYLERHRLPRRDAKDRLPPVVPPAGVGPPG